MRRKDKEITNRQEIIDIIGRCKVCRLAMCADGQPYVVPVNFGHADLDGKLTLYFHGARAGKKYDMLAQNPNVCVEFDIDLGVIEADSACDYGYAFESVICGGVAQPLESVAEKTEALNAVMRSVAPEKQFAFSEKSVEHTAVYKIEVTELAGKRKLP